MTWVDKRVEEAIARIRREEVAPLCAACRAALPIVYWASCHGSRCDEVCTQVEAAIAAAKKGT